MRPVLSFGACLILMGGAARAQTTTQSVIPVESRRLTELETSVQGGDTGAESAFWREMRGHVPLWELIPPNNQGFHRVTFVWRGDDSTVAVRLDAPLPPGRNRRFDDQGPRPLARLTGTQVWYRTERLAFDFRLLYTFHVTHRTAGGGSHTDDLPDPSNLTPEVEGGSVAEGVFAPKQPWLTRLPGVPAGRLKPDSLFSRALDEEPTFSVYTPAPGGAPPTALVVLFDGERYTQQVPIQESLDNLIAKGMIERPIVVFVNTQRWDRPADLGCNARFTNFVVHELLPAIRRAYPFAPTAVHAVIGGSSLGGLQAACTAFQHPEIFGRVLSLSGSYAWYPQDPAIEPEDLTPTGWLETGWLTHQVATTPRKPVRFYLATGTWEGDGLVENRRMRDVLLAKGYPLVYQEYSGGHDEVVWRGLIPDGLIALIPSADVRKVTP